MKKAKETQTVLLGIDLGSTHIKAAAFTVSGLLLGQAVIENIHRLDEHAYPIFDPKEMWRGCMQAVRQALKVAQGRSAAPLEKRRAETDRGLPPERYLQPMQVLGIGITGMAESGLLLDRASGQPLTPIYPWFDRRAENLAKGLPGSPSLAHPAEEAESQSWTPADGHMTVDTESQPWAPAGAHMAEGEARFLQHGVRPTYKCSLAKLLWIKEHSLQKFENAVWLGVPEYIAYRLTGAFATDYSLAGRTCAFRIDELRWDREWLAELGLPWEIFPPALPAGTPVGAVLVTDIVPGGAMDSGDAAPAALGGAQVVIAGHDHVCAALAASISGGGLDGSLVYDSIGTAEALVGAFPPRRLTMDDCDSGFSFGVHVLPGFMYWMGGINASGGSLEWLRGILGEERLTYQDMERLLESSPDKPGEILYLPFLSGRGSPHNNPQARAAFIGLCAAHTRADLLRAVLEGTALELACILERARGKLGISADVLAAAGGGVRNKHWMQMRADITGCRIQTLPQVEAALAGAAVLAGLGCGVYGSQEQAAEKWRRVACVVYQADKERNALYQQNLARYMRLLQLMHAGE